MLKQTLAKQTNKNEELAGQLIQAERNITKLQGINQQLINEINLFKEQQQQITATCDKYKTAYESGSEGITAIKLRKVIQIAIANG